MMTAPAGVLVLMMFVYQGALRYDIWKYGARFTLAKRHVLKNKCYQIVFWLVLIAYAPVCRKALEFFRCFEGE